jgi:hypothetical protein
MPAIHSSLLERITIDPEVRFGRPCVRRHRSPFRIFWSGSPQLEPDDHRVWRLGYAICSRDRKALREMGSRLAELPASHDQLIMVDR